MAVVAAGNGTSHPPAVAGALAADGRHAGAAAGIKGFLQMGVGAGATWLVGAMQATTPLVLVFVIAAALTAALAFHRLAVGSQRQRTRSDGGTDHGDPTDSPPGRLARSLTPRMDGHIEDLQDQIAVGPAIPTKAVPATAM